jgi:2-C-methyl-D-erythritol 2,4-cyclodiphosphate synthase
MRDIGYHFPDTAGEFKNIDSKILLAETGRSLSKESSSNGSSSY